MKLNSQEGSSLSADGWHPEYQYQSIRNPLSLEDARWVKSDVSGYTNQFASVEPIFSQPGRAGFCDDARACVRAVRRRGDDPSRSCGLRR